MRRNAILLAIGLLCLPASIAVADEVEAPSNASLCLDENNSRERVFCFTTIDQIRSYMRGGKPIGSFNACSLVDLHDLSDTYAVIDWIRAHPERQEDDLNEVAAEALQRLHPCS